MLTTTDAAKALGVTPGRVRQMIRSGPQAAGSAEEGGKHERICDY